MGSPGGTTNNRANMGALFSTKSRKPSSPLSTIRGRTPAEDGRPGQEDREFYIERFKQRVIYTIVGNDAFLLTVVHASRYEGAWQGNHSPTPPTETP
jgi:hypothetical protein